jgi:hypothetical protein
MPDRPMVVLLVSHSEGRGFRGQAIPGTEAYPGIEDLPGLPRLGEETDPLTPSWIGL